MPAIADATSPPPDPSASRRKINWTDRLIQASAVAGSVAGVATFLTEHPTAGLRLIAGSLLVGGVALTFRWRTATSPNPGFPGALALALIGAGAFGWSLKPGGASDASPPTSNPTMINSSPTTTRPVPDPTPATGSTSVTVHRAETIVPLSAGTEIDLDSLAPDWDVTGYDQRGRADLRFSISGLEAINDAQLREATGDGPELCQQATAQYWLTLEERLPETRYTCAFTNDNRFASIRFNREDIQHEFSVFAKITLTITVYNRPA